MSLNDAQRDVLEVNAARDKAEHLLAEMERVFAEARSGAQDRSDLTDADRQQGEQAIQKAMESARRMIKSLTAAKEMADRAAERGGWSEEESASPSHDQLT